MLEGLDQIEWSRYTHAYGSANDVPGQLRSLLSKKESVRKKAIEELFGNIYHQGTIYDATLPAVPFLIELLESEAILDREMVALLLASICCGGGYWDAHSQLSSIRPILEEELSEEGRSLVEEIERERNLSMKVRRAAESGLPLLLPFLFHSEEEL